MDEQNGVRKRRPPAETRTPQPDFRPWRGERRFIFFNDAFGGSTRYGTFLRVLRSGCLALGKYLQRVTARADARHFSRRAAGEEGVKRGGGKTTKHN